MHHTGLVSISFRSSSVEDIVQAASAAGLKQIEWGSDIHAPCTACAQLQKIASLQEQYGIGCCSYGTYFRLGVTPLEELPAYIRGAKLLGTQLLRLWAGEKRPWEYTGEEKKAFFSQCRQAAEIARAAGAVICLECHRGTYTETKEAALELMQTVNSPAFRMYWQPNPDHSLAENLSYIRLLRQYITHIHVFQWKGGERLPLAKGAAEWKSYLRALSGEHCLLLEFMPDDRLSTLPREAATLQKILEEIL